ncbi:hypothetical protein APTSU1_000775600 [Apodemus speciosus]|uniref:Uncharacterized protein n=1 Tax=Apodemus speciosus TaxID=105296 RepID=A0ABQ0EZS6_APOSI
MWIVGIDLSFNKKEECEAEEMEVRDTFVSYGGPRFNSQYSGQLPTPCNYGSRDSSTLFWTPQASE